jgi:hypothetical protein
MDSPRFTSSKAVLISASGITWVIIGSISILPGMYQSTIPGTSVQDPGRLDFDQHFALPRTLEPHGRYLQRSTCSNSDSGANVHGHILIVG